jgi:hypothetical protein
VRTKVSQKEQTKSHGEDVRDTIRRPRKTGL